MDRYLRAKRREYRLQRQLRRLRMVCDLCGGRKQWGGHQGEGGRYTVCPRCAGVVRWAVPRCAYYRPRYRVSNGQEEDPGFENAVRALEGD